MQWPLLVDLLHLQIATTRLWLRLQLQDAGSVHIKNSDRTFASCSDTVTKSSGRHPAVASDMAAAALQMG